MSRRITRLFSSALLLAVLIPTVSEANSAGIYDKARPGVGCTCHGVSEPTPNVVVLVTMDGVPVSEVPGFVPGQEYLVSIWVLGPTPLFAGFNLEFTGGSLVPVEGALDLTAGKQSQVRELTECGYLRAKTSPVCFPGTPGKDCGIVDDPECGTYSIRNPACQRCTTVGAGCRACEGTLNIDVQATHAEASLAVPKGKLMPTWDFIWTAPVDESVQSVTVYAVGNDVAGEGHTAGDFWNFMVPANGEVLPRL